MARHYSSAPQNDTYGDIGAWDGATATTIMLWHYQTASENTGGGAGQSRGVFGKGTMGVFKDDGGGALPKAFGVTDGAGNLAYVTNIAADDTWQNFCYVFTGSAGAGSRMQLYVNGVAQAMTHDAFPAAWPDQGAAVVVLGSNATGLSGWQGTLAHVKFWTTALTASEVALEWYHAEPQVQLASLILYCPLVADAATYDGTNAYVSSTGTPTNGTVSEPPVKWPAGSIISRNSPRRYSHAERRDRFQRLPPKRPLVQYG
jgi:hypothetical protein